VLCCRACRVVSCVVLAVPCCVFYFVWKRGGISFDGRRRAGIHRRPRFGVGCGIRDGSESIWADGGPYPVDRCASECMER
jgi:hypothetical protein